jgi:hypothetical protein
MRVLIGEPAQINRSTRRREAVQSVVIFARRDRWPPERESASRALATASTTAASPPPASEPGVGQSDLQGRESGGRGHLSPRLPQIPA